MSDSHTQDQSAMKNLIEPIKEKVKHVTADTVYDNNPTYQISAIPLCVLSSLDMIKHIAELLIKF